MAYGGAPRVSGKPDAPPLHQLDQPVPDRARDRAWKTTAISSVAECAKNSGAPEQRKVNACVSCIGIGQAYTAPGLNHWTTPI